MNIAALTKPWWARFILGLAAILLAIGAILLVFHFRSKSSVERYKNQLRAQGEKLNIGDLLFPRAEPENNGAELFNKASAYFFYSEFLGSNPPPAMRMVAPGKAMVGWRQTEIVSMNSVDAPGKSGVGFATNSWKELQKELEKYQPGLDLLHQATARPAIDFGRDYNDDHNLSVNPLMNMKRAAQLFSPAVICDLNRGDTSSAVTNLHTTLRLVNAWKEPTLIAQMVRIAIAAIAFNAQWETLQTTNLTDSELALLQHDWETMEFIQPMEQSLELERIWNIRMVERLRTSNSPSSSFAPLPFSSAGAANSGGLLDTLQDLAHAGKRKTSDTLWRVSWSYEDELRMMRMDQAMVESARRIQTNGFFKDALAELDGKIAALARANGTTNWLRNELDDEMLQNISPGFLSLLNRLLRMEATRQMAIIAIALKRYQLRHSVWPNDLKSLVPEFISEVPRDPIDGQPLRYRLNQDGTFLLYSIGSDGKDDGGDATPTSPHFSYWLRARDWVWPQPATDKEIQDYYHTPK